MIPFLTIIIYMVKDEAGTSPLDIYKKFNEMAPFKKIGLLLLVVLASIGNLSAQENPVHWKTSVEKGSNGVYTIRFTARIDAPWHMYDMGPYEGGPNATTITFTPDKSYSLVGSVKQVSTPTKKYDPLFEMEIGTFAGKATFTAGQIGPLSFRSPHLSNS